MATPPAKGGDDASQLAEAKRGVMPSRRGTREYRGRGRGRGVATGRGRGGTLQASKPVVGREKSTAGMGTDEPGTCKKGDENGATAKPADQRWKLGYVDYERDAGTGWGEADVGGDRRGIGF